MIVLLAIGALAVLALAATVRALSNDGHRRVPDRY